MMRTLLRGLCLSALAFGALALPAQAKPQAGKTFEDWTIECEKAEGQADKCYASQSQVTKEKQRVLKFSVGYLGPKGELVAVVILPLGITIPAGAAFKVDDRPQVALTLLHCIPEGCVATALLKDDELAAMKSGKTALVGVLPMGAPNTVTIPVSLKGFGTAMGALK